MSNTLQYSCLENPLSDREGWQDTVYRVAKSWTGLKWPSMHKHKIFFFFSFFGLSQLCPSESWAWRWCSCLAWRDPGGPKCAGTQTVSLVGVMALLVSFSRFYSWWSEGLFGQSFFEAPTVQAFRGIPCLGSFSVDLCVRHIEETPDWGPTL